MCMVKGSSVETVMEMGPLSVSRTHTGNLVFSSTELNHGGLQVPVLSPTGPKYPHVPSREGTCHAIVSSLPIWVQKH